MKEEYQFTWEETIEHVRNDPSYKNLVKNSYLDADLSANIDRYHASSEFKETINIFRKYNPNAKSILDIGSGNGITAINFARLGYDVTVAEPDPSDSVGIGAIRILKEKYKLPNLKLYQSCAEDIEMADESFDIVYFRQAMHHSYDLDKFVLEGSKVLKPGGLLLASRDHVLFHADEKAAFLELHPLQKFYHGENAYTLDEYKNAILKSGLKIESVLKSFDSVINCSEDKAKKLGFQRFIKNIYTKSGIIKKLLPGSIKSRMNSLLNDEHTPPGRMYSFIAVKPKV